ncbi:MAG TPA: hypothetical protein VFN74_23485, partial [Chloroflexota bacterium]|nr:hypothetical protein [Chloroflexota bacterium]
MPMTSTGVPAVYVERRVPDDDADYVSSDPVAGAALAVKYLHTLGRRRIASSGRHAVHRRRTSTPATVEGWTTS